MLGTRLYKGQIIRACDWNEPGTNSGHPGKWFIQGYHPQTGLPYGCQYGAHYRTLKEAREAVKADARGGIAMLTELYFWIVWVWVSLTPWQDIARLPLVPA